MLKKKYSKQQRYEGLVGLLFVLPEFAGLLLLGVFPLLFSLYLSFCKWNLVSGIQGIEFIGLQNFSNLLQDDKFYTALRNNLVLCVCVVFVGLFIALIISVIIHSQVYLKDFFKIALFIPYICTTVAVAAVWSALFHPSQGPVNQWLMKLGIDDPPKWLADPQFALISIIIITIWIYLGYNIVIYLAGLTNIPNDLYEASSIDGANGFQQLWSITIPLLSPTIFFLMITTMISSFKVFDIVSFLTKGGPNDATNVLAYYLYEEGFLMGYASAISWMLFMIIALITLITWNTQKNSVHY
jgi:multiple sugar transport system permease protein